MPVLDQFGTAISSQTLYKTPSQRPSDFRRVAKPRAKTFEALSAIQRREQVDVSRVIAAGVPNIKQALNQAGEFSIGDSWHLKSRGTNKAWGKRRDEWFNTVYTRDCNLRGPQNDWWSTLRQLNWTRKVEGDYAIVFDGQPWTDPVSGKEHSPTGKFMVLKYDRIATGIDSYSGAKAPVSVGNGLAGGAAAPPYRRVQELGKADKYGYTGYTTGQPVSGMYVIDDPASPFDGQRIIDGVIVDGNLTVLGYRIVGFNADGEATYADVPVAQIHFNFSARRHTDLLRGIPELAEAIIPVMGLDDIQYLVTMAIKAASFMAVYRKSTDGRPRHAGIREGDEDITGLDGVATTRKVAWQDVFPGVMELATENNEELGSLTFDRPSMNEESFIARIETSVLHDLWPRALIYAQDLGRAGARAIGLQANTICWWDQRCTERSARWIADRATAFAMRAGFIPANDQLDDAYQSIFTIPGKFTVDEGNDAKARLQSLGRCCISHGIICEMDGYLAEEIREERSREIDWILSESEKLAKKHPDWDARSIALMFDAGESNVSFAESPKTEDGGQKTEDGEEEPEVVPRRNGNGEPVRNGNGARH